MKMTAVTAAALLAVQPMMTRGPDTGEENRAHPPASHQVRDAAFRPATYNPTDHTVELVLSVGAPVGRGSFVEELEITEAAIDLGRVVRGLVPLLNTHSRWSIGDILGTVNSARLETVDGVPALVATARFADTAAGREAEGMVQRGELRGVSIGYDVRVWTVVALDAETGVQTWRATQWELMEASLCPVPADASAGVRSAGRPSPEIPNPTPGASATQEDETMIRSRLLGGAAAAAFGGSRVAMGPDTGSGSGAADPATPLPDVAAAASAAAGAESAGIARAAPAVASPAANGVRMFSGVEAVDFVDQARVLGVETRASELVAQNGRGEIAPEAARDALLRAAAERQRTETQPVAAGFAGRAGEQGAGTREAVVNAIVCRVLGTAPDAASREFIGMRLLELAASRAGISPRERDPLVILRAAHTSSDFPMILEAAANKILLSRYTLAQPTYRAIARRRDLQDFKATKLLSIGDFPTLLPYAEDGEIKSGTINEGRETVVLGSYGRILRLTRQAIINDDLGAFDDVFATIGSTIAQFENATFWAIHNLNSGLGPKLADNQTVFHASHSNVAASGAAPSITTLGAGRASIRKQKNIDGNIMSLPPKYIVVGPDLETSVDQLVAAISSAVVGEVNPFAGKLTPIVEGSIVGNAWELYADPAQAPVWSYGYLASAPGPRVMTQEQFNTDGVAFRATLDFYADATDYRGAYRNAGA